MKQFVILFSLLSVLCLKTDARITYELSQKGAIANVVICVVDQDGCVVPDARIWGAFTTGSGFNDYAMIEGLTNNEGKFVAQGRCNELLRVDITKDGYYSSELKVNFWQSKVDPIVVDGKWQPYGEEKAVVLKKIKSPLALIKDPHRINKAISFGEWFEYDLIENDWVEPYGVGKNADVSVKLGMNAKNDTSDFCVTMDLDFSNIPYSGVYLKPKDVSSEFKSDYHANANEEYKSQLSFKHERHPHMPVVDTRLNKDSYLVFRIRTKTDENGKLISAHYGKINGPWSFFGAMNVGELYFNPTPNDTNLEDAETARKARLNIK